MCVCGGGGGGAKGKLAPPLKLLEGRGWPPCPPYAYEFFLYEMIRFEKECTTKNAKLLPLNVKPLKTNDFLS